MALKIFGSNSIGAGIQGILGSTDNAIVAEGVIVGSTDDTAIVATGSNQNVTVDGSVSGAKAAVQMGLSSTVGSHLLVREGGDLAGFNASTVTMLSSNSVVENRGTIWGAGNGVAMLGNDLGSTSQLINSGTIESDRFQTISHEGAESVQVINSGLIKAHGDGFAYLSFEGASDSIMNTGNIVGSIQFGTGNDVYDGRGGHLATGDFINGNRGNDTMFGGVDGNTFNGEDGSDFLDGGAGNDTLSGGLGIDRMFGRTGADTYFVDTALDLVSEAGGNGIDTVLSSINLSLTQSARLVGAVENLTLLDGAISGTGNGLANAIAGNAAGNALNGKLGRDVLTGGLGADAFTFNTKLSAANIDTITDFNHAADTMRLENGVFTKLAGLGTLSKGQFHASASGLAHDANDRIIYETDTGTLFYDANGHAAGGAVQIAQLSNHAVINNTDFFII